jgi:outer membrane assembly lipoprotein YfiO
MKVIVAASPYRRVFQRKNLGLGPVALVCCMCLSGCSVFSSTASEPPKPEEPKAKEIPTSLAKPSELGEDELIFRAKRYYEVGLYTESRENFEAIKATYPLGAFGEFAEIKSADALFDTGAFADAAKAYEELARARPVSEALPYVMFRTARAHQLSQRGIGRDMTALDKAQSHYEELLKRFPNSRHSIAAKQFLAVVINDKAEYAKSIRDFYQRRGKQGAAESREKRLQGEILPVLAAATSAAKVGESNVVDTARLAKYRAEAERSNSAAIALNTGQGDSGRMNPGSASATGKNVPAGVTAATEMIVKTTCANDQGQLRATLFLNKELSAPPRAEGATVRTGASRLEEALERTECGTSGVILKVDAAGTASFSGAGVESPVIATTLPNPSRVIILATVQ